MEASALVPSHYLSSGTEHLLAAWHFPPRAPFDLRAKTAAHSKSVSTINNAYLAPTHPPWSLPHLRGPRPEGAEKPVESATAASPAFAGSPDACEDQIQTRERCQENGSVDKSRRCWGARPWPLGVPLLLSPWCLHRAFTLPFVKHIFFFILSATLLH